MFNVLFYFLTSSYILAANLNSLWQAVMSNSYEYQSTEVNLENAEIDNLKAYSAALPNASITPSENKIEMSLNFSPATFSALQAANHTLREKKYDTQNNQLVILHDTIHRYFSLVSLAKQRKSLKFEITNNDKYLKKAKAEFEEGLITKATLALWQTRLNQAQINLLTLDAKIADAQKEIAVETGLHLDKISVFSNKRPIKLTSKKNKDLPDYIKSSISKVNAADATEMATYLKAVIPDFTLALSKSSNEPNKVKPSYSFSLNLSPTLNGMSSGQAHRIAKLNALKKQRENTFRIKSLKQKSNLLSKQILAAKSSYLSALDRFQASLADLKEGKITEVTFSDSITDVSKQRTALIIAETDLLKNHVSLLYEYGQLNANTIAKISALLINEEILS